MTRQKQHVQFIIKLRLISFTHKVIVYRAATPGCIILCYQLFMGLEYLCQFAD